MKGLRSDKCSSFGPAAIARRRIVRSLNLHKNRSIVGIEQLPRTHTADYTGLLSAIINFRDVRELNFVISRKHDFSSTAD